MGCSARLCQLGYNKLTDLFSYEPAAIFMTHRVLRVAGLLMFLTCFRGTLCFIKENTVARSCRAEKQKTRDRREVSPLRAHVGLPSLTEGVTAEDSTELYPL